MVELSSVMKGTCSMAKQHTINSRKLNNEFKQMELSYRACLQAMKNGKHDDAVKLQLVAIESYNCFNDYLLKELEWMIKPPKQTWIK